MMGKERNAFTNSIIIVDRYKTFVKSGQPCIYCGSIDTGLHLFSLQKEYHVRVLHQTIRFYAKKTSKIKIEFYRKKT